MHIHLEEKSKHTENKSQNGFNSEAHFSEAYYSFILSSSYLVTVAYKFYKASHKKEQKSVIFSKWVFSVHKEVQKKNGRAIILAWVWMNSSISK